MPKRRKARNIPHWIRQRAPEPYPGAALDWLLSEKDTCCCPHFRQWEAAKAALARPAQPCFFCALPSVTRRLCKVPDVAYPPAPCGRPFTPMLHYDLCESCNTVPGADARVVQKLRLRAQLHAQITRN
jgi:hypothetical protein